MMFKKIFYLFFICFTLTCQSQITYNKDVDLKDIKLILFDFGGGVLNMDPLFKEMAGTFRKDYPKIPENQAEIKNIFANRNILEYIKNDLDVNLSWLEVLKQLPNIYSVQKLSKDYLAKESLFDNAKIAFKELFKREYQFGMITAFVERMLFPSDTKVKNKLKKEALDDIVKHIHVIGLRVYLGEKYKIVQSCLKQFGFKPEQVLYIGDERIEMEHYGKAGVKTCAVSWGINSLEFMQKGEYPPTISITELEELLQILPACEMS